eukprot:1034256_1
MAHMVDTRFADCEISKDETNPCGTRCGEKPCLWYGRKSEQSYDCPGHKTKRGTTAKKFDCSPVIGRSNANRVCGAGGSITLTADAIYTSSKRIVQSGLVAYQYMITDKRST